MRILNWYHDDFVNGEGIREVIFVAGCIHRCKGCFNPESWDFLGGTSFSENDKLQLFERLERDYISGVTFSGGDPLCSYKDLLSLCKEIKLLYPDKTIWVYTGFTEEVVREKFSELLSVIDVIVTEPFIESLKDPKLEWVGSSNQKVIYLNN